MKQSDIVYIHLKDNLYGYAAINPEDFEKITDKDKVLFKINKIMGSILPFNIKIKFVNKILKARGLRNLSIFNKDNEAFFIKALENKNCKGWLLAYKN